MPDLEEKFTKLKHEDCSLLNKKNFYQLNKKETNSLNVLNEKFFSETLDQAYPFIADLLCINIKNYNYLNLENKRSKEVDKKKFPFIIGVTGSVASGKSTFSKIIKLLLKKLFKGLNVELVTTDGFLYPNSFLEENNLMEKKGFPESYDIDSLLKFLSDVKLGKLKNFAPVYSHILYDVIPDEKFEIIDPDILIIEGINVLQPITSKARNVPLIISDFLDFSIYIDAEEPLLRTWYIDRFLSLRQAAADNEEDFFNRFLSINDDQAKEIANSIWEKINLVNLNENILPTKNKANLILKKNINHEINEIWLRNI